MKSFADFRKDTVQIDEMTQGKEYTQQQLMKKIQSGNWEATHDIKPGKHVEMRHHSGKRVTVQVKEEAVQEASELGDLAHQTTMKHRFLVTYSDPNHTSASMRKEKQQKHVLVPGTQNGQSVYKGEAEPLVKKYMKKQGYRVHEVEHVGMVSKKVNEETSYLPNRHIVSVVASKDGGEKQHIKLKVSATSKAEAKGIARLQLKKKGYETHSATHHGIDYSGFKKEEVDQLDELSKETLKSYVDKVSTGPSRGTTPTGTLKSIKAIGGVTKAIRKQYANSSVSEEHEHAPLKSFAAFASEVN